MWAGVALVAAAITLGLMAGLYYGWAISVMPGLRSADDRTFVDAFQRMNVAIINGWFFLGFFGAAGITGLALVLSLGDGALPWTAAALVLYLSTIGTTIGVNVPLNNMVAAVSVDSPPAELAAVRQRCAAKWVRWNVIRALLCTAALGCLAWALVEHGRALGAAG